MHKAQRQVEEFHRAVGLTVGRQPAIRDPDLRSSLILEEANETADALDRRDLLAVADGLCDLLYVAYGTAVSCGLDLEPFFDEVHRSNLRKLGGPIRPDGKRLKPTGWVGPQLEPILKEQLQASRSGDDTRDA